MVPRIAFKFVSYAVYRTAGVLAMTRMALALWHSRHLDVALGAGGTEKKGKSFFMHFYRFYFANVQLVSVGASSSNMEA